MQHRPKQSKPRSFGRVLEALFFGHPQVLVMVPVSVALLTHAIIRLTYQEPAHGWTFRELLHCTGAIAGFTLFFGLSVFYLGVVIVGTLKRNGNGTNLMTARTTSDGNRLDCIVSCSFLRERIAELAKSRRLIGPVERANAPGQRSHYFYEEVANVDDLALDFTYCVYSPKKALLPERETLLKFDRTNGTFKTETCLDDRPTAIVGVHPCDLHAIEMLDAVFSKGRTDPHYAARRNNMFLVGVDCAKPCGDGIFCRDIGTNQSTSGFDVMLYPLGDKLHCTLSGRSGNGNAPKEGPCYGVMFGTDAGREWLKGAPEDDYFLPEGRDMEQFDAYLEEKDAAFPNQLDVAWEDVPATLRHSYDSLLWGATARRCYSCGSCNLVCPTCYCFDIQDENDMTLDSGRRERTWDGCMLREFAVVAGDHNFRDLAGSRLRHRIYRKVAWIEQHTGQSGCVGCARCDRACTAQISIKQILNQLSAEAQHASH